MVNNKSHSVLLKNTNDSRSPLSTSGNSDNYSRSTMNGTYQNQLGTSNNFQGIPINNNTNFNEGRVLLNQPYSNGIPLPPPRRTTTADYGNPYRSTQGYNNYAYGSNNYLPSYNSPFNSHGISSPLSYRGNTSYMMPYNTHSPLTESSFLRDAQESSRNAFSGIESIVTTFGSINMMIESTYCALQSSLNAVLSVIDNLSRLKTHFGQILSAFTLIRTCQWLLRKFLYLIGLRARDPTKESAWKAASTLSSAVNTSKTGSSWHMYTLMIAVYALPYLVWKSLSPMIDRDETCSDWTTNDDNEFNAVALYNYRAKQPDELSFTAGEKLTLAPLNIQIDKTWPMVFNGTSKGFIPINYVKILRNENFKKPVHNQSSSEEYSGNEEDYYPQKLTPNAPVLIEKKVLPSVHKTNIDPNEELKD